MQNRQFSPLLIIGIGAIAVAMALVGFFWLGGPSAPKPVAVAPAKPEAAKAAPVAEKPVASQPSKPGPGLPSATPQSGAMPNDQPPPPSTGEQLAREQADMKIGTLLAQNPTVEGARDKLLLLYPSFTPYEKIAAAPHINNLTGDDKIRSIVDFLKSPNTPPEAQETFFNDMLNRPPQIGWPVLIEVIATPNHPLAQRAKELLTTIVGQDFGNDVFQWQAGLRAQLKLQGAIEDDPPLANGSAAPAPVPSQAPQQPQQ